jgi:Trypsin
VRLGTMNKNEFEEKRVQMDIPKENIFIHENYDSKTTINDIALIKMPLSIDLPKQPKDDCKYL